MRALSHYQQAAIAYAVYGTVYLVGAIFELSPERRVTMRGIPWWFWYVMGPVFIAVFPMLIARQWRKLTLALSCLVGFKALYLFWQQGRHLALGEQVNLYNWFFAIVAVGASVLLFRAGFPRPVPGGRLQK